MRHGEKGDRTGPIQVGTLLVNGNWNLCQGHGKGQWPNLFSCLQQSTSCAPEEGRERLRSYGQCPNAVKCSMSSTKALCRKPRLSYSYEYDKPSDLLAAIPINPSQAASCPHRCLDICHCYPATAVLLPSPAPIWYGLDGLVGLAYTWEIPPRRWDKIKKQQIKAIKQQFCSEDPLLIQAVNTPLTQVQAVTQLSWGKSWHCPSIQLQHQPGSCCASSAGDSGEGGCRTKHRNGSRFHKHHVAQIIWVSQEPTPISLPACQVRVRAFPDAGLRRDFAKSPARGGSSSRYQQAARKRPAICFPRVLGKRKGHPAAQCSLGPLLRECYSVGAFGKYQRTTSHLPAFPHLNLHEISIFALV